MDLSEALAGRRSCRSYLTDPVAPDVLDPVLAGWGPPLCLAVIVLWLALRDGWQAPRRLPRS